MNYLYAFVVALLANLRFPFAFFNYRIAPILVTCFETLRISLSRFYFLHLLFFPPRASTLCLSRYFDVTREIHVRYIHT